jgi:hypothetical protein
MKHHGRCTKVGLHIIFWGHFKAELSKLQNIWRWQNIRSSSYPPLITTPLAAMDPDTSSYQAVTSKATRNSARSMDMQSAIPKTSGGSWNPCNLDEEILSSLEQEGLIAATEILKWRVDPNATTPAPSKKEIVMLKSHIDRGLSLPPSYFLKSMLRHYRL